MVVDRNKIGDSNRGIWHALVSRGLLRSVLT